MAELRSRVLCIFHCFLALTTQHLAASIARSDGGLVELQAGRSGSASTVGAIEGGVASAAANAGARGAGAAANYSLLIPVECGYGFRNGKLCPGYPQFACPDSCHNRTLAGRVEMLASMMRGIAATADRGIPTTVIVSHPVEFNATGPPSPRLPKPMDEALAVLRTQGVKVAHYIMTRLPPPLPCCTCCNSYTNITRMVDRALSAYPDDSIFYDNGPFAHTESLYLPLYTYAKHWGGREREVLFNSEWTTFEEVYLTNTSAVMMAYEGYGSTIEATATNPSKFDWSAFPRARFAMCIENVTTSADAVKVVQKGTALHFGSFFITSQTADYSILPSYWTDFVDYIAGLNNGSIAPPPPAPHPSPAPTPPPTPSPGPPCLPGECHPVVHYRKDEQADWVESSGGCGIGPSTIPVETSDSLIIAPGRYCFESQRFDLLDEGLYQFADLGQNVSLQRIVFSHDLSAMLSAVAWIGAPGNRDPWEATQSEEKEREALAMTRKLSIACGTIADIGVNLVNQHAQHLGARARRVHLFTVQQPWNDYDDGHYQMELHRGQPNSTWELWDLDFNVQPMHKSGRPVTALEMLNLVRSNQTDEITLRPIARDALYDVSGFAFDGVQYLGFPQSPPSFVHSLLFFEEHIMSVADIETWYHRIYGGIDSLGDDNTDSTCGVACGPKDPTFIASIGLHFLADSAFDAKYYPTFNPPAPPTPTPVGHCPAKEPHIYGDSARGLFCCSAIPVPTPPTEGCPSGASYCCLQPGTKDGCQGAKQCAVRLGGQVTTRVPSMTGLRETKGRGMPSKLQNTPVVYLAIDSTAEMLQPSTVLNGAAAVCSELPDQLVIRPGDYCWVNQSWSFSHNGVARFAFWCSLPNPACTAADMVITQQRVVYDGENTSALLSSIAWLSAHGALDAGASPAILSTAALTRKLSTDSASLIQLAVRLMAPPIDATVVTRAVTVAALKPASMSTRYGRASQTLLEYHDGSDWIAVDLDNDCQPLIDGNPTSVHGLRAALPSHDTTLSFAVLAGDTSQDNTGLMAHDNNASILAGPFPYGRVWAEESVRADLVRFYLALFATGDSQLTYH